MSHQIYLYSRIPKIKIKVKGDLVSAPSEPAER